MGREKKVKPSAEYILYSFFSNLKIESKIEQHRHKGGLFSESFFILTKMYVTSHYPEHYPPKDKMIVLWQWTMDDVDKRKKLSEFKPPLKNYFIFDQRKSSNL